MYDEPMDEGMGVQGFGLGPGAMPSSMPSYG